MKEIIDDIDRKIIYELDKNSKISDTALSKKINKSKEATRYRIKKLIEKKIIIGFTTWIDPVKLGYKTIKIYLNLANIPEKKKEFIEYVKKDKRLFWLGVAEGAWNAGLTYFVKSNDEFFILKNDLFSRYKDLILESKTASVVGIYFHEKNFLSDQKTEWASMFTESEDTKIDALSIKITKALFKNSRENIAKIAYDNKTSVDKVRTRIRNLEESGIIKKYTIMLNYEKLGYEFYKTFLYFKSLNENELKDLMNYTLKNKNTIHLVKAISPWDIELEIMCRNFIEYNEIISNLTEKFSSSIGKVETSIMSEDHVFPSNTLVFE